MNQTNPSTSGAADDLIKATQKERVSETEPNNSKPTSEDSSSSSLVTSQSVEISSPTSAGISSSELLDDDDNEEHQDDQQQQKTDAQDRQFLHGHTLPSGWTCNYDAITDHYSFEFDNRIPQQQPKPTATISSTVDRGINVRTPTRDDTAQTSRRPTLDLYECKYGYHFPTTPTSSMISELARQVQQTTTSPSKKQTKPKQIGYGKHKLTILSSEEEQLKRLNEMFPTATAPVIEQMVKIYHGREGLIKAALISLGYKRATEYTAQQATAQSPILLMMSKPSSKKLFDKLVSYFPDKDEALIKSLMFKYKEVEHEIISSLVESSQDGQPSQYSPAQLDTTRLDKNGAIMKLRYLKFLYPTCEEIELYHLLHCNDLNAQKVMEEVEKRGHKRANIEEVFQNRKSQTQQMRAQQQAHLAKDKAPKGAMELVEAHQKRPIPTVNEQRLNYLKDNLRKLFPNFDDGLLQCALEASDFNEGLAKKFLEEMDPVDDAQYRQRYELYHDEKPSMVAFPCKAIQIGNGNFMSVVANEYVYIAKEVIECDNALALLKVDASTFTSEDFENKRFTHRRGKRLNLAAGSSYKTGLARPKLCPSGPKQNLRVGSKYEEICHQEERSKPNTKALGRNETLAQGNNSNLRFGHNTNLLQRIHPFFK